MTHQTPIERAALALFEAIIGADEIVPTEVRMAMLTRTDRDTFREGSRAVYKAIDTDELADVIAQFWTDTDTPKDAAQAVKNWLTGKDTQ